VEGAPGSVPYGKKRQPVDSLKSLPQITDPAVETNIPIVLQTKRNYRGSAGGHGASKSGAETDVSVEVISAEESSKPEKPTSPAPTSPLSKSGTIEKGSPGRSTQSMHPKSPRGNTPPGTLGDCLSASKRSPQSLSLPMLHGKVKPGLAKSAGANKTRVDKTLDPTDTVPRKSAKRTQTASKATQTNKGAVPTPTLLDWNKEFYKLQSLQNDFKKFERLASLANDFVYAAESYGKIIISERYLPVETKSLKPNHFGGIAGGQKYMCQSILFKFAVDTDIIRKTASASTQSFWMYGGEEKSDRLAAKSAAHDLKGLTGFYNSNVEGLRYPLMTILDYRGFRLIALSLLPIEMKTIRYGSNTMGVTVLASDDDINVKMEAVAKALNLKGHYSGRNRQFVHMPGDIEAHRGIDNNVYVIDFARVFPPEDPGEAVNGMANRHNYYRLLRPEFVRRYPVPLSSDAFSAFSKDSTANAEITKATLLLYNKKVPEFVDFLLNFLKSNKTKEALNCEALGELVHRHGLNLRHLGRVRRACPTQNVLIRQMLLVEILARVLKNSLNGYLRKEMEKVCIPSREPYVRVMVTFLNRILKNERAPRLIKEMKRDAMIQFPNSLDAHELETGFNLLSPLDSNINLPDLIDRLLQITGIQLSQNARDEINAKRRVQLIQDDIIEVKILVKRLSIIDMAIAKSFMYQAQHCSGPQRVRLFKLADRTFKAAAKSSTHSTENLYSWATCLIQQADCEEPKKSISLLQHAETKLRFCAALNASLPLVFFKWGTVCIRLGVASETEKQKLFTQARDKYARAVQIDPTLVGKLRIKVEKHFEEVCKNYGVVEGRNSLLKQKLESYGANYDQTFSPNDPSVNTAARDLALAFQLHDCLCNFIQDSKLWFQMGKICMMWSDICFPHVSDQAQDKFAIQRENLLRQAGHLIGCAISSTSLISCNNFYYYLKTAKEVAPVPIVPAALTASTTSQRDTLPGENTNGTDDGHTHLPDKKSETFKSSALFTRRLKQEKTNDLPLPEDEEKKKIDYGGEMLKNNQSILVDIFAKETRDLIVSDFPLVGANEPQLLPIQVVDVDIDSVKLPLYTLEEKLLPTTQPNSFLKVDHCNIILKCCGTSLVTGISFGIPPAAKKNPGRLLLAVAEEELKPGSLALLDKMSGAKFDVLAESLASGTGEYVSSVAVLAKKIIFAIDLSTLAPGSYTFPVRTIRPMRYALLKLLPFTEGFHASKAQNSIYLKDLKLYGYSKTLLGGDAPPLPKNDAMGRARPTTPVPPKKAIPILAVQGQALVTSILASEYHGLFSAIMNVGTSSSPGRW